MSETIWVVKYVPSGEVLKASRSKAVCVKFSEDHDEKHNRFHTVRTKGWTEDLDGTMFSGWYIVKPMELDDELLWEGDAVCQACEPCEWVHFMTGEWPQPHTFESGDEVYVRVYKLER